MQCNIREEVTDFGKVYYINTNTFRFALHYYNDDLSAVYLTSVFVNEKYRGRGLGNLILSMAEDIAKQHKFETISLKCKIGGTVHDWYKRHGYTDLVIDD